MKTPPAALRVSKKWRCRRHCCHSIVAGTTAVVPARFVSHLRVANRLRRLCPPGTRFPTVPAGVIGAEPLSLVPQHFPRKPARRCLRATAANLWFFDSLRATGENSPTALHFSLHSFKEYPYVSPLKCFHIRLYFPARAECRQPMAHRSPKYRPRPFEPTHAFFLRWYSPRPQG